MGFQGGEKDYRKIHLVGESMGGHIVGYYASLFPRDLDCVTMVCPHGIDFEEAKDIKEEILRTGEHHLTPNTLAEYNHMMSYLTHKPIGLPNLILKGMFHVRITKNVFYKKRKCSNPLIHQFV